MNLKKIEAQLEKALRGTPDTNPKNLRITRRDSNPQTNLDKRVNEYLGSALRDIRDVPIMSEENPEQVLGRAGLCWIVDPVDGTINAIAGTDDFAICASLVDAEQLRTLVGVVYLPRIGRLFKASAGMGAYENERSLATWIHEGGGTRQKIAAFGVPSNGPDVAHRMSDALRNLFSKGWVTRQYGAASIDVCRVASGSWSAFFEYGLMYWDFSAAALVAAEAGCEVRAVPHATAAPDQIPLEYDLIVARTPEIMTEISTAVGIQPVGIPG
jgi:myo-inositol-1(or 4)-monophosphatase